jgi:hypothetical protein
VQDRVLVSYSELADQVAVLDDRIRFAGIVNKLGRVVACNYRKELIPLLNGEGAEDLIPQSIPKICLQPVLESKFGRTLYCIVAGEKVKRVTIPLFDSYGCVGSILFISFNADTSSGDIESLITERIVPLVKGNEDRHCRRFYRK